MKKNLLLIVLFLPLFNFAQTTITIGSDSAETGNGPIYVYNSTDTSNSWTLYLYDKSEIVSAGGYSGNITRLSWFKTDTTSYPNPNGLLDIYIKNTPYSEFTFPITFDQEVGDAIHVYHNSAQSLSSTTGWIDFPLNTPFYWNGSDNIIILTRWIPNGFGTGEVNWQTTNIGVVRISHAADQTLIPGLFNSLSLRPNIKIQFNQQTTNDAGVTSLDSVRGRCPGSVNIYATIKNYGSSLLDSVRVNWDIDGSIQTPVNFIGTLSSLSSTQVLLGSTTLASGVSHSFRAWASNPNGIADTTNFNDTISVSNTSAGLSGTYTIGSVGSDYNSFASAFSSLENNGVCGPTEFLIDTGIYMEKLILHEIPNASAINYVVFRSATNDSSDVMIEWPASSSVDSNYTLRLEGTKYVTFKALTLSRTDTNSFSNVVELSHGASHLQFLNNRFMGTTTINKSDVNGYRSGIFCQGNLVWDDLEIRNNYFIGNANGIWLHGTQAHYSESIKIENNVLETFYSGSYLLYQKSPAVNGNIIKRIDTTSTGSYNGIFIRHIMESPQIQKNRITSYGGTYGIRVTLFDTTSSRGLIANNFIQVGSTTGGTGIAIEANSRKLDVFNNSVNCTGINSTGRCLYISLTSGSADLRIMNNIFSNPGSGYAMYINTAAINQVSVSDNNCFYSTGSNLAYIGNNQATLADLQSASQRDSNSVNGDPNFVSFNDLHTVVSILSNSGSALPGLTEDIDGDVRDLVHPDIGADEFADVGIANIGHRISYKVYPNPVRETLTIDGSGTDYSIDEITIIDLTGREVLRQFSQGKKCSINVSKLSTGFYLLKLAYSGNIQVESIIKYE